MQEVIIACKPIQVYEAFMDEKQHEAFTGFKCNIDHKVGGKFVTCGNRNFGYSLVLEKGKRIIQAWSHRDFPNQEYTIADIALIELENQKSKLIFHHIGVPKDCYEWLTAGWQSTYWLPLKKYLEMMDMET